MTLLSAVQVADYWIGAGGPRNRAVEWLAIAMGESGLDDRIVSPAGAIGLWQIMPFNAPPYGYTPADLYNPAINARVAVIMSGGGTNCAAWDSCYLDIQRSGRYSFLAWPEQGSPDYINLPLAQAALAGHGLKGITSPGQPGIADTLPAAIYGLQIIGGHQIPAISRQAASGNVVIRRIGKRGWRP